MKRNAKATRQHTIQVWTYAQAQAAAPYIGSIVRSIRDYALEALSHRRTMQRIARQPGRPGRNTLIQQQEADNQARRAEGRLRESASELHDLDVYSLDPVQGLALVPFVHEDQLAWYIFDVFDSQPFRFWRFQSDPDDTRRPITPAQQGAVETSQIV